jgi:uncharacterized protein YigE (DUF2233 family)
MRRFFPLMLLLALVACNAPLLASPTPTPSPAPSVDTGWQNVAPGVDYRSMPIPSSFGQAIASMARVDPTQNAIRVHYDPTTPRTVTGWHTELGALVTINAGFFLPDNTTLGLIVADGVASGSSFNRVGGMLTVNEGGEVDLRALSQQPYQPGETFQQAVQGRPMLIFPGGTPTDFTTNGEPARRTVVALDDEGRLLLIAFNTSTVNLNELQTWLASLPGLDAALNLDGGGSTGFALTTPTLSERFNSFTPVPSVIAVTPAE